VIETHRSRGRPPAFQLFMCFDYGFDDDVTITVVGVEVLA